MMAKPSAISSSLMVSGGLVMIVFQRTNVYSPWSRRYLPTAFVSGLAPL